MATNAKILHAVLTSSSNGIPVPFPPATFDIAFPPSPPRSPATHLVDEDEDITVGVTSLQCRRNITAETSMWPPSWHVIHQAASLAQDQYVISVDTRPSTPCAYVTDVLDPLFCASNANITSQRQAWKRYMKLNEQYADKIIEQYKTERDIIWVHDYQLLLLPAILRRKLPRASVGLSMYARFPSMEYLLKVPEHKHILQGILSADLIGFQTEQDIRRFSSACALLLSLSSLPTTVMKMPTTLFFHHLSFAAESRSKAIRQLFPDKRIVLCQETHSDGALRTLAAIERFLSSNKALSKDVVFIHLCSSNTIPEPLDAVPDIVRQINQLYGSTDFVPIHFYHQELDAEEYDALLAAADVALVMGQHPMATVAAQAFLDRHHSAPLVVSQGTPMAEQEGTWAVHHSDSEAVASAIRQAMEQERKSSSSRHATTTLPSAQKEFLKKLQGPRLLNTARLVQQYRSTRGRRLFLFDYDGTLTPIVPKPEDARPTPSLLHHLQALCDQPDNVVWVVSGRDQATLEAWLGAIHGLGLSAEHGSFMKMPGQSWIDMLADADMSWKSQALDIFEAVSARTPGTVVEQKKSSITWHYRNALDPEDALRQCEACYQELTKIKGVDILRGKMNLEVRSLLVNKGEVVKRIQQQVNPDFILCAGDDRTDEDMFRALRHQRAYCVSIGPQDKETLAQWHIDTPEEFVACLGTLVALKPTSTL